MNKDKSKYLPHLNQSVKTQLSYLDLIPDNLRRQSGPEKARKDSYSALVLGNWMIKIYYDMTELEADNVQSTFTPMFIG